jgi:hypothetical protein
MLRILVITLTLNLILSVDGQAQQGSVTCTTYGNQTQCSTPAGSVTCTTYGGQTYCQ